MWVSEIGAINPPAYFSTDFIHQTEIEGSLGVGSWLQRGGIDIITKTQIEVIKIKAGGEDKGVL